MTLVPLEECAHERRTPSALPRVLGSTQHARPSTAVGQEGALVDPVLLKR